MIESRLSLIPILFVFLLCIVFISSEPSSTKSHNYIDKHGLSRHIHHNIHVNKSDVNCSHIQSKPWQIELNDFVHSTSTKTILYIFYHDVASRERAMNLSQCYDWMFPVRLKLSPYMENQVYQDVFYYLQRFWLDHNVTYVITTSYKVLEHNELKLLTLKDFAHFLQITHRQDFDFTPLVRSKYPLLKQAFAAHGKDFKLGWDAVLTTMGYSRTQIDAASDAYGFYKSAFIAKTQTFMTLINFMTFATNLMEYQSDVKSLADVDGKYVGGSMTPEQKQEAFQSSGYKMYPFILERLPVFYVYHMKYRICDAHNSQCPANFDLR